MQAFLVIHDRIINHCLGGGFNVSDVGQDGAQAHLLQAVMGALTHAARQHDVAIGDVGEHAPVLLGGMPAKTSAAGVIVVSMFSVALFLGKLAVPGLIAQLA
jgi:hypothetical protein